MQEPVPEVNSVVESALAEARVVVKRFVSNPGEFNDATGHSVRDEAGQKALVDMAMRATAKFLTDAHAAGSLKTLGVNESGFSDGVAKTAVFAAVLGTGYDEKDIPRILFNRARSYGLIQPVGERTLGR